MTRAGGGRNNHKWRVTKTNAVRTKNRSWTPSEPHSFVIEKDLRTPTSISVRRWVSSANPHIIFGRGCINLCHSIFAIVLPAVNCCRGECVGISRCLCVGNNHCAVDFFGKDGVCGKWILLCYTLVTFACLRILFTTAPCIGVGNNWHARSNALCVVCTVMYEYVMAEEDVSSFFTMLDFCTVTGCELAVVDALILFYVYG